MGVVTYNKSLFCLAPLLCLNKVNLSNIKQTYLYYGTESDYVDSLEGEYLYFETFKEDHFLESSRLNVSKHKTEDNTFIYKIKFNKLASENFLVFLEGRYSEFTKEAQVVTSNVFPFLKNVFSKHISRRKILEKRLGMKLPENAELLSIFDEDSEFVFINRERRDGEKEHEKAIEK